MEAAHTRVRTHVHTPVCAPSIRALRWPSSRCLGCGLAPGALTSLSTGVGTMPLAHLGDTVGRGVSARQPGASLLGGPGASRPPRPL